MLKKSDISSIKIHTDKWKEARLGKFTSSRIGELMSSSFDSYVRKKVGESLTDISAEGDINTEATVHGNLYEPVAIKAFMRKTGVKMLVTQQLITTPGSRFSCTPDGIIVVRESPDGTEYEVETLEIKCPLTFDNYILLFECKTPQDLKAVNKMYYWQVIDQMLNCGASKGHFAVYHPDFRVGNFNSILFDKGMVSDDPIIEDQTGLRTSIRHIGKRFPIYDDMKLLEAKKAKAVLRFDEIRSRMIEAGTV